MNKKPFDLQKALAGEPVVTRLGEKVSQLTKFTDLRECYYPVIGVTEEGEYLHCKDNGRQSNDSDSTIDLFMAPVKTTMWVNVWSLHGTISCSPSPHRTEAEARSKELCKKPHYIGTYPIEIEL